MQALPGQPQLNPEGDIWLLHSAPCPGAGLPHLLVPGVLNIVLSTPPPNDLVQKGALGDFGPPSSLPAMVLQIVLLYPIGARAHHLLRWPMM